MFWIYCKFFVSSFKLLYFFIQFLLKFFLNCFSHFYVGLFSRVFKPRNLLFKIKCIFIHVHIRSLYRFKLFCDFL
jgi:hypothetical protein